jgi:hypothetical protein
MGRCCQQEVFALTRLGPLLRMGRNLEAAAPLLESTFEA